MTSNINLIVNLLTCGLVLWLRGLEDSDKLERIVGAIIVFISIILNIVDTFKLI